MIKDTRPTRGQSRPDAGAQSSRFLPPEGSLLCAWCGHPRPGRGNPDVSAPAPGEAGLPTCAAVAVLLALAEQQQREHHQQDDQQTGERHHQEEPPLLVERCLHLSCRATDARSRGRKLCPCRDRGGAPLSGPGCPGRIHRFPGVEALGPLSLSGLGSSPRRCPHPGPWPVSLHSPSFISCLGYGEGGTEVPGLAPLSQYGGFLPRHPQIPWPPPFPLPPEPLLNP